MGERGLVGRGGGRGRRWWWSTTRASKDRREEWEDAADTYTHTHTHTCIHLLTTRGGKRSGERSACAAEWGRSRGDGEVPTKEAVQEGTRRKQSASADTQRERASERGEVSTRALRVGAACAGRGGGRGNPKRRLRAASLSLFSLSSCPVACHTASSLSCASCVVPSLFVCCSSLIRASCCSFVC